MIKPWFILLIALVPTATSAADLALSEAQLANTRLSYTKVVGREFRPRLALTATLVADPRMSRRVTPVVDGIVVELLAVANETVSKGQILARLHSDHLGQAQAAYLETRASFDLTQAERARIERLWKDGIVAESRWLKVDSDYKRARAALQSRRRLLSLAGLTDKQIEALAKTPDKLAELVLVSPIDGLVSDVAIEPGQRVAAGQPAFRLVDVSRLWAEVQIPVAKLALIELDTDATLRTEASPGRDYAGRLQSLASEVERGSQTLAGRVVVANPDGRLRPGLFARVELVARASRGLMVPASAVFWVGDRAYVFEVTGAGKFRPVKVVTGVQADGWIPLLGGIAAGTDIVSSGVAELKSQWQYQGGE